MPSQRRALQYMCNYGMIIQSTLSLVAHVVLLHNNLNGITDNLKFSQATSRMQRCEHKLHAAESNTAHCGMTNSMLPLDHPCF